ncbi:sigma-54-dependent Fis family transcriptional regulator [Terribacillus saccharophilus]|uniref:sigma-54-dependent Fis family transcriptional regulator n=1 Tax=Terribacillus saccharophilus TaxID=361277 RepID=UPI002DC49D95|nr:PrpR N-terminal domain-containing protein [Terribacillus saccharophilus]
MAKGEHMTIKILFIAPYNGLKELVNSMKGNFPNLDIDVLVGDLDEGARFARQTYEQYDLIISRGGTAQYIKQSVPIPVVEVKVSGYDVLKVLTLAEGYPGRTAIVGFSNISEGARTIAALLDLDIKTVEINSSAEVETTLKDLQKEGIKSVIGDTVTIETAKKTGLNGILITSGSEAVSESFQEAIHINELLNRLKEEIKQYKQLLKHETNAYMLVDSKGKVIEQNQACEQFAEKLGREFEQLKQYALESIQSNKTTSRILMNNGNAFEIFSSPFKDDLCWIRVTDTLSAEQDNQGVRIEDMTDRMEMIGSSSKIQTVYEQIKATATNTAPIRLIGEKGAGKLIAAKEIHRLSTLSHLPFATILCDAIPSKDWKTKMESILTNNHFGTCYLTNLETLSTDKLKWLVQLLKDRKTGPRILSGIEPDKYELMFQESPVSKELLIELASYAIELPSIKDRKEDIESWAHYLISYHNTESGGQIVGFRESAISLLKEYDWPGNIDQLNAVIEQLIAETNGYHIELETTEKVIQNLRDHSKQNVHFPLEGTLEEIEKEIIKAVLKEENYNKSKTASRLGINRSTLWRKLQS